jgi:argininosuccinate lyase
VLVKSLEPDTARMRSALDEGYLEATDVAEFLVKRGVPFRTAYQASKLLVRHCIEEKKSLRDITQADFSVHEAFERAGVAAPELVQYLEPQACVARRMQTGGPAPLRVREQIERLRAWLALE